MQEEYSDTHLVREGVIEDVLRGNFRVRLKDNNETTIARVSGKLRMNKIHLLLGDHVKVKFSVYDPQTNGIIISRI